MAVNFPNKIDTGSIFTTDCGAANVDAIASALSTSLANYNAANTNDLVAITAAEYNNLVTAVSAVKTSMSDSRIATASGALIQSANTVQRLALAPAVGSGVFMIEGYTVAVRVRIVTTSGSVQNNVSVGSGFQIGYGTTTTGAGVQISNIYTTAATTDGSGFLYFAVKTPTVISPVGALPTMKGSNISTYGIAIGGTAPSGAIRYRTGAANVTIATTATIADSRHSAHQFLQTPVQQW